MNPEFSDDSAKPHEFGNNAPLVDAIRVPAGPRGNRAATILSWLVIVGVTLYLFSTVIVRQMAPVESGGDASSADLMQVNMMGKVLVGQVQSVPTSKANSVEQVTPLDIGTVEQRFSVAILLNELESPERALRQIAKTDRAIEKHEYVMTESQSQIHDILVRLFSQYEQGDKDATGLARPDRELLENRLGWVGELVLNPPGSPNKKERRALVRSAQTCFFAMIGACTLGGMLMFLGILGVGVFLYLIASGKLNSQMSRATGYGGIYAETFAIWLLGFVGIQFGIQYLFAVYPIGPEVGQWMMPAAFFGSLSVLCWPMFRGVSFSAMREDIGLKFKNPFKESGVAAFSYSSMLPPMLLAGIVAIVIGGGMSMLQEKSEFGGTNGPAHPIQDDIAGGDFMTWVVVFVTACVAAPIVEETMFRGVLFRHLRDASSRWGDGVSIAISVFLNSLIFASIHPQGLVGIPLLTTLAIGFSLVRLWRNSLMAPMAMHALHNGMVTCFMFLVMA